MRATLLLFIALLVCIPALAEDLRPVSTYSIVARDPQTGALGVAVQSHWFGVGRIVPWAEAGTGAVATQAATDPNYGPLGITLMRAGRSAPDALRALLLTDPERESRQVAMIDYQGGTGVHTGANAIAEANHLEGENYAIAANLMANPGVPEAMAEAFENAEGDLAAKMIAALEAAQAAGGDLRGRQSAALIVVRGEPGGEPWQQRLFDLRVDDHEQPVAELKRLAALERAYRRLAEGDAHLASDVPQAARAYMEAVQLAPDERSRGEIAFWSAVGLAGAGRMDEAAAHYRAAVAIDANWERLLLRLPAAGLLTEEQLEGLQGADRRKDGTNR